ncbi:MAG: hypothetical protein ACI83P_000353 [Janthinobacterium sp.]|jgi:hypothetical protein
MIETGCQLEIYNQHKADPGKAQAKLSASSRPCGKSIQSCANKMASCLKDPAKVNRAQNTGKLRTSSHCIPGRG